MEPPASARRVRISEIGGCYLLFDIDDVVYLRREHSTCAFLVGTTPQAPNQNLFGGLPLELAAEEASLLVDRGVAFVEDDCAAHLEQLSALARDPSARAAYAAALRRQRRLLQAEVDEKAAEREKHSVAARAQQEAGTGRGKRRSSAKRLAVDDPAPLPAPAPEDSLLFDAGPVDAGPPPPLPEQATPGACASSHQKHHYHRPRPPPPPLLHFTPTTSSSLLALDRHLHPQSHPAAPASAPPSAPLRAHLYARGYYTTPGLRFGGAYSVYPGDPFRYHAHFTAASYGWDERVRLLDLIGGGRLATGVKKGFLIAGEQPPGSTVSAEVEVVAGGDEKKKKGDNVRAFTLEWASM